MNFIKFKTENIIYIYLSALFLIAILPKPIQMCVIAGMLLSIFLIEKKVYIDRRIKVFFIYIGIYVFSVLVNSIKDVQYERILASINTILLWFFGIIIFSYVSRLNIDKKKIKKILFINSIIYIAMGILVMVLKLKNYDFSNAFLRKLVTIDWANNEKGYRFSCMMEYPNLAVLFYFLIIPFAFDYIKDKKTLFKFVYLTLSIIPVIMVNSRIGILLVIINYIYSIPEIFKNKKTRISFSIIILIIIVGLIGLQGNYIFNKIDTLINSRSDSTSMRSAIYRTSIEKTVENSILWGSGIKTMFCGYPLGSHSTYIGVFYKTGIIGTIVFLVAFGGIVREYMRNEKFSRINKIYKMSFISLCIMLCIEDIDGANWLCILFFILIGVYLNNAKEEKSWKEK